MMSTPQPYPTVANNTPAPDDAQIESKMPSICVDYLSHQWTDEDVWSSWKAMTKQKDKIANGVRLENASWRTWAKQRGKLKTISPETLNWLKDSDVTWLYGPLHEHADPVPPPRQATTADRLDLDDGHAVRSILKHRTISELLTTPGRAASPGVELNVNPIDAHMEAEDAKAEEDNRGLLFSVKSDSNLVGQNTKRNVGSPVGFALPMQDERQSSLARTESTASEDKRHISFNHRVEQCIALDRNDTDYDDYSEDEEDDDRDDDETSEEEEVLTMKSSPRVSPANAFTSKSPEHPIIAKLAPTSLKTSETYPAPSPAVVDPTGFLNSQPGSAAAAASTYPGSYGHAPEVVSTAGDPTARGVQWDVDEDFSGDFDYFNGPDLVDGSGDGGSGPDSGPVFNTGDASSSPDATRSYTSYFDTSDSNRPDAASSASSSSSAAPQETTFAPSAAEPPSGAVASVGPRGILKKRPVPSSAQDDFDGRLPNDGSDGLASSQTDSTGSFGDGGGDASRNERGRTSQRLGSSASYERIQEAARSSRPRSNSGGSTASSHSPNGVNGSYDDRYTASTLSSSPNAHRGPHPNDGNDGGRDSFRSSSDVASKEAQGYAGGTGREFGDRGAAGVASAAAAGAAGTAAASVAGLGSRGKAGKAGSSAFRSGGGGALDSDSSDGHASYDLASPNFPASPPPDGHDDDRSPHDRDGDGFMYGDERSYWSDDKPSSRSASAASAAGGSGGGGSLAKKGGAKAPGTPSRTHPAGTKTSTAAATAAGGAELSVDTENVPSNAPTSTAESPGGSSSIQVGPTPLNTPTFILSKASGKRRPTSSSSSSNDAISGGGPNSPTLPRRTSATGALVAPHNSEPRVPLAHDYVEEDEGGIVGRAVEIVNTARDLIGALLGTGDRGRSWREG
ncbi:uncharacterized protein PFL1_05379 [Pseudozyma flocculosa PF-1]|uniref:Related to REG1 - regulatory subunit for protein phosphatase Glc7p n=2 Tax=Pseudozyma flocculosa TaxID=84751 RepID=A0A5C3FCI8_9BASI|nr:uncharacterized protein PFL1_05379 [Pseudozyma flocculosa PF-1]EPQ27095.1 hypothetical protein PFL1_05379 [Pseudozyma flocculosa PF-1]SPO41337.1 related to REG1 - regulatory subunit for protein phosphatase Glc7p [Pseudozyma flocculosa]